MMMMMIIKSPIRERLYKSNNNNNNKYNALKIVELIHTVPCTRISKMNLLAHICSGNNAFIAYRMMATPTPVVFFTDH